MYITQNLNEKLKVPVMWKLSTAFFPCSKDTIYQATRPQCWQQCHCCVRLNTAPVQSEPSGAAGNNLRDGPDRTKAEALAGREPHHRHGSEGDTLGHAVELFPLLLSACAVPLLWSDLPQ